MQKEKFGIANISLELIIHVCSLQGAARACTTVGLRRRLIRFVPRLITASGGWDDLGACPYAALVEQAWKLKNAAC